MHLELESLASEVAKKTGKSVQQTAAAMVLVMCDIARCVGVSEKDIAEYLARRADELSK